MNELTWDLMKVFVSHSFSCLILFLWFLCCSSFWASSSYSSYSFCCDVTQMSPEFCPERLFFMFSKTTTVPHPPKSKKVSQIRAQCVCVCVSVCVCESERQSERDRERERERERKHYTKWQLKRLWRGCVKMKRRIFISTMYASGWTS